MLQLIHVLLSLSLSLSLSLYGNIIVLACFEQGRLVCNEYYCNSSSSSSSSRRRDFSLSVRPLLFHHGTTASIPIKTLA